METLVHPGSESGAGLAPESESAKESRTTSTGSFMLWIDGVGSWLLCTKQPITIGGPSLERVPADICLMSSLSRNHAAIDHENESWFLEPRSTTQLNQRIIQNRSLLRNGDQISFGNSVELTFGMPSTLSASAVIDFVSEHRPARSVDGIVLMLDNCLLGPGRENHVRCPDWPETVILFQRNGQIHCRSRTEIFVDGQHVIDSVPLQAGSLVTADGLRFRFEPLSQEQA